MTILARIGWQLDIYPQVWPASEFAFLQERARVSALKRLGIDYTSKEQALDFITKLITNVCACSAATICLIDSSMCYIKSTSGGPSNVTKVDRRLSISMYCLVPLKPEVLVVEDLTADARYSSAL